MKMPSLRFPEMRLRADALVPPTVLSAELMMLMPLIRKVLPPDVPLPSATVPDTSVPT